MLQLNKTYHPHSTLYLFFCVPLQIGKTLSDSPSNPNTGRSTEERRHEPNRDDHDDDEIASASAFDWILDTQSPVLHGLLATVRDRRLPGRMIAAIGAMETRPGEAACIQLLLCKCSPFLWGMQRSIGERIDERANPDEPIDNGGDVMADKSPNRMDGFFRHLPAMEEFRRNGVECEQRYGECFAKSQ